MTSNRLRLKRVAGLAWIHAKRHTGVGVVCAVAYFDPGNWGVDLQAGSEFGYHLLFVVLLAGLFAAFLQVLSSRLGCVTGLDLAYHCRLLLYNRPRHTKLYRWLGLYPLYLLAEIAVIATDLAELLGSAIALCLLFPRLKLWQGVLITAFDVILILAMRDPLRGKPVRIFELLIAVMVLVVLVCMLVIISKVEVNLKDAFSGYLPSKHIFAQGGVYTSVGIIGATVMPHSLFLGSTLATQDRVQFRSKNHPTENDDNDDSDSDDDRLRRRSLGRFLSACKESLLSAFHKPPPNLYANAATRYSEHTNNSYEFVRAHIYHGTVDMIGSLLGFAVVINSLILMLASSVFFYSHPTTSSEKEPASLFDAYDLIRDLVGLPAAKIFAVALLCAGQSSSIIATVAGQAIAEGFLQWRVSAVVRRLLTRLLAIIPSMIVAIAVGRSGVDRLLVASQVVLSIVLPFILFPLIWCTSSKAIMSVRKTQSHSTCQVGDLKEGTTAATVTSSSAAAAAVVPPQVPAVEMIVVNDSNMAETTTMTTADDDETVDYSNHKIISIIAWAIWLLIGAANVYALVEIGLNGV